VTYYNDIDPFACNVLRACNAVVPQVVAAVARAVRRSEV